MTPAPDTTVMLLPCPFCGGDAVFLPYKKDGLTLRCSSLGCIRRDQRAGIRLSIEDLRESMVRQWNRRAALAGQADAVGVIVPRFAVGFSVVTMFNADLPVGTKLYATPPAAPMPVDALREYIGKLSNEADTCDAFGGARNSLRKRITTELTALIATASIGAEAQEGVK